MSNPVDEVQLWANLKSFFSDTGITLWTYRFSSVYVCPEPRFAPSGGFQYALSAAARNTPNTPGSVKRLSSFTCNVRDATYPDYYLFGNFVIFTERTPETCSNKGRTGSHCAGCCCWLRWA